MAEAILAGWPEAAGVRVLSCLARYCTLALFLLAGCSWLAAKDTAGIVLFDGSRGPAYVQLTAFTLNGKAEVRLCQGVSKFDKNTYNSLPRAPLTGASSLQRGEDGVMTLTINGNTVCAVPSSVRFDKKPQLTPAEAADQTVLQGTLVSSTALDPGIPELKPTVQIVFAAVPNFELADFLRSQRSNTLQDWQDFVGRYPSSSHVSEAKKAMADIHELAAEAAFAQYQHPNGGGRIPMLRQAYAEAEAANQASAGYSPANKLMDSVSRELDRLVEADRAQLEVFRKSLAEHQPGYSQLSAAQLHIEELLTVQPDYGPVLQLRKQIASEQRGLAVTLANAESLSASGWYDDALTALGRYNCLASEIPRIDAVVSAAYKYHLDRGRSLADQQRWEDAATEFRIATAIRPDSKEALGLLNNATLQLSAKRDQEQAESALLKSNEYASKNQYVEAYEVLADLPDPQRELVVPQLSALTRNFVTAATRRAQEIQESNIPIKGRADEDAVREACALLDRVSSLTNNPALTLKRNFLSNKISTYYLDQAHRYLQKASGSGAGLAWLYFREAQRYGITNVDNLKDEMAHYALLYKRRARVSVGIALRDQTSRRDSPGFADQLADAIASSLESAGSGIEVVRKLSDAAETLQPNFMLVGEVLDHRVVRTANLEAPQSRYRAGTHETKNPAWLKANSDYDSAQQQLALAQQALADAHSQHRKKDVIASAADALQRAQQRVDELRHNLETIDESRVEPVIETYHYTKKTVDLSGSIELVFRLTDRAGILIGQPVKVHKNDHKTAVVLEHVKPEDTEGITNQGIEPDGAQFLTDLEIQARDMMVSAVREKMSGLPPRFLQEARARAQRGDTDGAAEQYIIYLNSTPGNAPAQDEAVKFLAEKFNLSPPHGSACQSGTSDPASCDKVVTAVTSTTPRQ